MILGAIILNEPIDLRTIVAGAIIVTSVALIVTARSRMPAVRPQADDGTTPVAPEPVTPVPAASVAPTR